MPIGVIYKITNITNSKTYIGQTIEPDPFKRINRHFVKTSSIDLVYKAFLKYGRSNFTIDIICSTWNIENLNELEIYFIEYYKSHHSKHGYNIKLGGAQGGKLDESTKLKISIKNKAHYKLYGSNMKGRKFTKEHKEAMSKVRKGFDSIARKLARGLVYETMKTPIIAIKIITNEIQTFESIEDCAKELNLTPSCISRVLRNDQNRKQHKGYRFEYLAK